MWHSPENPWEEEPWAEHEPRDRESAEATLWLHATPHIRDHCNEPRSLPYLAQVAELSRAAHRAGLRKDECLAAAVNISPRQAEKHRKWARDAGYDTGQTPQLRAQRKDTHDD